MVLREHFSVCPEVKALPNTIVTAVLLPAVITDGEKFVLVAFPRRHEFKVALAVPMFFKVRYSVSS